MWRGQNPKSARGQGDGSREIVLLARTANQKFIFPNSDRLDCVFAAAHLAGAGRNIRGAIGVLEPTQFADGVPGHHGI